MTRAGWALAAALSFGGSAAAHPCKLKPVVFRTVDSPWTIAPEAAQLEREGGFRKSNAVPLGQKSRHGIAEAIIAAEPGQVLASMQRYEGYRELAPNKFKTSRLVALQKDGASDVYMQVLVLRGALTLWLTMRFAAPHIDAGARVVEGRYLDGNLEGAHVRYVVQRAGEQKTYVRLELLIDLPVPAPQDKVDEELRDAAGDALRGVTKRF